jgi:hypothetical protein
MGKILEKLKALFKRGSSRKGNPRKHRRKRGGGYRSPEEFHEKFENRYGKPGRVPEDV